MYHFKLFLWEHSEAFRSKFPEKPEPPAIPEPHHEGGKAPEFIHSEGGEKNLSEEL